MPAPIIGGLIDYIAEQLQCEVWDGEVPRYDTYGKPINPESIAQAPQNWPVVKLYMKEGGFRREWNVGTDPYSDEGRILISVWGTTRASVEGLLGGIEAVFASSSNWWKVNLGGPSDNAYYVIQMLLENWYCGQEEGVRTGMSKLMYRGDLHYKCNIHGAISTQ